MSSGAVGVQANGWAGSAAWSSERLARRCGVARALDVLPAITEAFAKGQLSYSQVRALSRVAEPATEPDLLEIARHGTAAQLERLVRSYRGVLRQGDETEVANQRHDRRYVNYHWDDDGSLVLNARLDPEEGAVVLAAIDSGAHAAGGSRNRLRTIP